MTDYAKKTVAELTEILKSKGLSHTGKKADLVARLTEANKAAPSPAAAPESAAEAPASVPAPKVLPLSDTSTTVPNAPTPSAPSTAGHENDATTSADAPSPDTALAQHTYALNLPTSTVDAEMERRKKRAERFGTAPAAAEVGAAGAEDKDAEALKALERARRFGTGETAIGKLDEALPMDRERGGRKRVAEGGAMDDPGLRNRGVGNKRLRGGRGGRTNNGRSDRPAGVVKNAPAFISERDRLAAEARKKKFATA